VKGRGSLDSAGGTFAGNGREGEDGVELREKEKKM